MLTVHIGMGKCGTTTLQKLIFPKLEEMINISYLSSISSFLGDCIHLSLTEKRLSLIKKMFSNYENILISSEGLIGPNSHFWEKQADENLRLFGKEARIIITLREPYQIMRSLYQQNVHMGSVIKAKNFFLNDEEYKSISKINNQSYLKYFNVDSFDYEKLYEIYKKRFRKVIIVPMSSIKKMNFLGDLFNLNYDQIEVLKDIYQKGPNLNISYSKLSMDLTFLREKFLSYIGVRSIYEIEMKSESWLSYRDDELIFDMYLNSRNKKISFLKKLRLNFLNFLKWRFFIQKILDKLPLISSKRYEIPKSIYLNERLLESNRKFLDKYKN